MNSLRILILSFNCGVDMIMQLMNATKAVLYSRAWFSRSSLMTILNLYLSSFRTYNETFHHTRGSEYDLYLNTSDNQLRYTFMLCLRSEYGTRKQLSIRYAT